MFAIAYVQACCNPSAAEVTEAIVARQSFQLRRKARVQLERESHAWQYTVETELSKVVKRTIRMRLTRLDQQRLLTLRAWVIRYKVSLHFILSALMSFWLKKGFKARTDAYLGIRVSSLVGKHSKRLLEDELLKRFPNNENIAAWKSERLLELCFTPFSASFSFNPEHFGEEYVAAIRQKQAEAEPRQKWLRRPFRDNPVS